MFLQRERNKQQRKETGDKMKQDGTEFLPLYIQLLIKKSGGIGFERLKGN